MSEIFPHELLNRIEQLLPETASGHFLVAFSGGLDSTALLHAMSLIAREVPRFTVRAIHIDHQLQAASAAWREHSAIVCAALGMELVSERVTLSEFPEGVEAAARKARYDAMRRHLQPGDTLLTAHHADDQLETVLLALVRGSGVDGLAAMPAIKAFGTGWHMRPLLESTRAEVEAWARAANLEWIDDPSNEQSRFDRNYLRNEVVPALRQRWPAVAASVTRSAGHLAQACDLLAAHAAEDLQRAQVGRCLDMRVVADLPSPRRRQLLRYWLADQGARMPSTRKLAALENDLLHAASDRTPEARWDNVVVRRHGELLYCDGARESPDTSQTIAWSRTQTLTLPYALGELRLVPAPMGLSADRLPQLLTIRFRRGGERLQLAGHQQRSHLKNLLQEALVLPWWRNCLPLLYAGERLIAVADLWTAADFSAAAGEPAISLQWEPRPEIRAIISPRRAPTSGNTEIRQ